MPGKQAAVRLAHPFAHVKRPAICRSVLAHIYRANDCRLVASFHFGSASASMLPMLSETKHTKNLLSKLRLYARAQETILKFMIQIINFLIRFCSTNLRITIILFL